MTRPNSDEAIIRQRMIDIVLSIRPLPASLRPSDQFVQQTRRMLLGQDRPASLLLHRRQRTLARLEDFTK
jgi:hypothetical protein